MEKEIIGESSGSWWPVGRGVESEVGIVEEEIEMK